MSTLWRRCGNTVFFEKVIPGQDPLEKVFLSPIDALLVKSKREGDSVVVSRAEAVDIDPDRLFSTIDPEAADALEGWLYAIDMVMTRGMSKNQAAKGFVNFTKPWMNTVMEAIEVGVFENADPQEVVYSETFVPPDEAAVNEALAEFGVLEC